MKARFYEILQQNCDKWGLIVENVLLSRNSKGIIAATKAETIYKYRNEFPMVTWKTIGNYMGGLDHSSVIHLYNNFEYGYYNSVIDSVKDYSSFVSFGCKVRFTFKYV